MYVTLEPCPMCAGGIVNARIDRTVIALADAKSGALRSVLNFNNYPLNHKTKTEFGLMENEARELMTEFFAKLRIRLKKQ
jgi:tRNA(adenine34) deaminase